MWAGKTVTFSYSTGQEEEQNVAHTDMWNLGHPSYTLKCLALEPCLL